MVQTPCIGDWDRGSNFPGTMYVPIAVVRRGGSRRY